ncbi:MAG: ParA family protein [Saprospiraceae bacterium]|nr:ParA family protein [Saprospiraceae bacterium]
MSKTLSIANFKGGVGKTTSTINIGAALQRLGKRVLLVDLDPQFNLTQSLGISEPTQPIYGALRGEYALTPLPVLRDTGVLDAIPSSLELIKAEIELSAEFKREEILNRLLAPLTPQYDYILLDCPPSLGLLTINAFVSSDDIYVPIEAEFLALKGYAVLNEAIGRIGLSIDKVFITKFDGRKILNRNVSDTITHSLGEAAFKTIIRENVALAEAPTQGLDIFRYAPRSIGAEDYRNLTNEITARG